MVISGLFFIQPTVALADMASLVGRALAVPLVEETTGRFEEFPAFIGVTPEFELQLLGPPAPEHDFREVQTQDYALQVFPRRPGIPIEHYMELHARLASAGIQISDAELPPNTSLERTREG